jgi:hypothetical protein
MTRRTVDIEIYEEFGEGKSAPSRYLVHGLTDVMWTDDLSEALGFLQQELSGPPVIEVSSIAIVQEMPIEDARRIWPDHRYFRE